MSSEIEADILTELKYAAKPLVELGLYGSTKEFIHEWEAAENMIEVWKQAARKSGTCAKKARFDNLAIFDKMHKYVQAHKI